MKFYRDIGIKKLAFGKLGVEYNLTDAPYELLHKIDIRSNWNISSDDADKNRRTMLSVSSLMVESIVSSQIEGAVATTRIAKKMLREGKSPKNKSEHMIVNNYRAMEFIRTKLDVPLTPDLIREIHAIITRNTIDNEFAGQFRLTDDVVVANALTGEIAHEPSVDG